MSNAITVQPKSRRGGFRAGAGRTRNLERAVYKEAVEHLRKNFAAGADDAIKHLSELVKGVLVEETGVDGKPKVYRTPPNFHACVYWIDRIMGRMTSEAEQDLAEARTALALQQVKAGFYVWQSEFLQAQAEGKRIENELVPKQFVSEEEEREHIQTLLLALNRPLLHMTPEKAAEFGISPDQLEDLKGYLGVSQAAVIEEVFEGKAEDVLDEDEEEGHNE